MLIDICKIMELRDFIRKIIRECLNEESIKYSNVISEIDWQGEFSDVQQTCMNTKDVVDYLNRVRANADKEYGEREKFKRNMPFIHAKSSLFNKEDNYVDVDYFIKNITEPPNTIITDTNEKIRKTGGVNEYVYKTGIPAFRGIVYDKKNDKFHFVNTCPGAGSCVAICYAIKGNYVRYPNAYDVMTRRLNYLLNHPRDYEEQMYREIKNKAEEHNAYEGYKSKVIIRWNDSGDFFSKVYLQISKNVLKRLKSEGYNVDSYAYTKVADVAKDKELDATFSTGADKKQMSKINLEKYKNAQIIPSTLSKGLDLMKYSDEEEYKQRVVSHFNLKPEMVITYDEMLEKPKGDFPKWYVIVSPGDGDDAAFRKDVKTILLTQH